MSTAKTILQAVGLVLFLSYTALGQNTRLENKILVGNANGPSPAAFQKAAIKAMDGKDYFTALRYYERALEADTTQELLLAYANVAAKLTAFDKAEAALRSAIAKYPNATNYAHLSLADALYNQGRYDEARAAYSKFLTLPNNEQSDIVYAEEAMERCIWAKNKLSGHSAEIEIKPMSESVNSPYSEFAPFIHNDKLYFSSYQFPFPSDNYVPKRTLIKVLTYAATDDIEETLVADFNSDKQHTAHAAFNKAGDVMYMTRCDFVAAADIQCAIYARYQAQDGSWSDPVRLPDAINEIGANTTEPAVGYDATLGQEVLFFASDRMGSKGKRDIYYALILEDGAFAEPVNIEAINTPMDEVAPFYHNSKQTLYFSSDGLESMGGYDIYSATGKGNKWNAPVHLPSPLNTAYNELYYVENPEGTEAYFSSNRPGALYLDTIGCCYDIFNAKLVQPEMLAVTFDEDSGDSLSLTTMYLYENSGGNEEIKQRVLGAYTSFPLVFGKNYTLIAEKEGYTTDTITFNTETWEGMMVQELHLMPSKIRLIANAFDGISQEELAGTTCRFIDLGAVTANGSLATAKDGGFLLDKKETNKEAHTFTYALDYDHKYKVLIMKDGYTMDSVEVSTVGMQGSGVIERDLFLRRGLNLEAFTFDAFTKEPLLGTTVQFIELADKTTQKDSKDKSHTYYYSITNQKRYRIIVSRAGYLSETVEFTAAGDPSLAFQTIRKNIYLKPANLTAYLPLKVYFDNDEPDKRTTRTTTDKSYGETFYPYYTRKPVFSNEYATTYSTMERSLATQKVEDFFENDVKGGWERLILLSESLQAILDNGNSVTLVIKGFASPRAKSNYNKYLTSRRIASLKNHFADYEGGIFKKYLASGALRFVERPFGEDTAPAGISDDFEDTVNSIYNIRASRERRVEIVDIQQN